MGRRPREHSAPLGGRAWQLGCGARRVLTCRSGKLGKGAAGAGPGHDQPMGRRHSVACYIPPGKWRGREPGESSKLQSGGRPWRRPESPRDSWERRVRTQGLKMPALSSSAGSGRPRPCCLSPGLCCDTCSRSSAGQRPLLDVGPHVQRGRAQALEAPSPGRCREGSELTHLGSSSFGAEGNDIFKNI